MKTREICLLSPKYENVESFFSITEGLFPVTQIGWVEVWAFKPNGDLICTKGETLRPTKSFFAEGWVSASEKVTKAMSKIQSELFAQGWRQVAKTAEAYWCFERDVITSHLEDKEPTALIDILNNKIQKGTIDVEVGRKLQNALVELMKMEQTTATKSEIQTTSNIADQLVKLAKLYQDKAITKEEYETAKRKLLG